MSVIIFQLSPQPFHDSFKMGASLESVNALKSRALGVALSSAEANALETNGITSLARLAFPACHPGQPPTDAQLQPLLQPIPLNAGNAASLKRLIFEAQTLVCNEFKIKANRKDDAAQTTLLVLKEKPEFSSRRIACQDYASEGKKSAATHHMTLL